MSQEPEIFYFDLTAYDQTKLEVLQSRKDKGELLETAEKLEYERLNSRKQLYLSQVNQAKAENGEKAIIEAIAKEFSRQLLQELGDEFFKMVDDHISDNVKEEPFCVSHSYCDSNMCMLNALELVLQQSWNRSKQHEQYFNDAWDMAKNNDFYHTELELSIAKG